MSRRTVIGMGVGAGLFLVLLIGFFALMGDNDDQNWQVVQSPTGNVEILDAPGWYLKGFATVWTWPRAMEAKYDKDAKTDERISVTFNDGGKAQIDCLVRFQMPTRAEDRRKLHRDFSGNPENVISAVRSHLVNCIKLSGPLMSASEHQAARKAEFNEVVGDQLRLGLFKMKKVKREIEVPLGKADGQDRSESVLTAEIITDKDGRPIVMEESPLKQYGIEILQLSLGETEYDPETLRQFAAKKDAYLAAERAKAQQQEEVSQRLMVIEKGKREVAEIEATSNKLKMTATVKAQQEREVADIDRQKAVIDASKKVEVAGKELDEANKRKQIAEVEAQIAELRKKATISVAEAEAKKIEIAGGLAEKDRILAEIKARRDVEVAQHLAKVGVPQVVLMGGQGDGKSGSGSLQENLINLWLLRSAGVVEPTRPEVLKTPVPQK